MNIIERARGRLATWVAGALDTGARATRAARWAFLPMYGEPNAEKVTSSYDQLVERAYGGNAVVFGVLNVGVKLFSEVRPAFRDRATKKLDGTAGELDRLNRPWPNGTAGELFARARQDAYIAGNAYIRDAGDRLERLRPDWVTIVSLVKDGVSEGQETADGRPIRVVVGYLFDPVGDADRDIEFYDVDEVAHWAPIPDPAANWRGMSVLTPALKDINADIALGEHRDRFWRNAATPNMIIKYANKLGKEGRERLADAIAARHGGPDKAGGTLVLDEGGDPQIVGAKFSDAQVDELMAAGENRIAVAAGVPALVAGLKLGLDDAAWSMYRQALRAFVDLHVRPDWRTFMAAVAVLLAVPDGVELWYDASDVAALQEGEKEAADVAQVNAATINTLITAGYEPDSITAYLLTGDLAQLKHTGRVSVQLHDPNEKPADPAAADPAGEKTSSSPAGDDDAGVEPDATRAMLVRAAVGLLGINPWSASADDAAAVDDLLRAWNPRLHPRDAHGRFREVGSVDLVASIDVRALSDRRLVELFGRISAEDNPAEAALVRLGDELDRRERAARQAGPSPLAGRDLTALSDDELDDVWMRYPDRKDVWEPVTRELNRRRQVAEGLGDLTKPLVDWDEHRQDTEAQRRIDKAVAAGDGYADAYAEAYAATDAAKDARRRDAVDVDRRAGETRRMAVRRAYSEHVHLSYIAAEKATRGHLLSDEGRRAVAAGKLGGAVELFSGPATRARRYASDELKQWWQDHGGRVTAGDFSARVLAGAAGASTSDQTRDFGV